jgi:hypothetical protein
MRANTANSLVSELDGHRRAAYIVPGPELSTPLTLEAGRVVREAEGLSTIGTVVTSPCDDGTGAPVAAHHGAARQDGVCHATCESPRVGEDLDEWMELCYYASRHR